MNLIKLSGVLFAISFLGVNLFAFEGNITFDQNGNISKIVDEIVSSDVEISPASPTVSLVEKPLKKIAKIVDITNQMVENAVNSFIRKDAKLAEKVCKTDDKVDKLHDEIFSDLIDTVAKNPESSANIVSLIFINKFIERIADHADNISEDVIYIARGKSIKHQ